MDKYPPTSETPSSETNQFSTTIDGYISDTRPPLDTKTVLEGVDEADTAEKRLAALADSLSMLDDVTEEHLKEIRQAKLDDLACSFIKNLVFGLKESIEKEAHDPEGRHQYSLFLKPEKLDLSLMEHRRLESESQEIKNVSVADIDKMFFYMEDGYPGHKKQIDVAAELIESTLDKYKDLLPPGVSIELTKIKSEVVRDNPDEFTWEPYLLDSLPRDAYVILKITASIG